ncbi:hypothetical protein ACSBPH_14595 [Microbacterium sp. F51-2R]|uniref:hypothetical protein n=1 Tax=Microbacterium sp. F51-2R TaxID=3445777 RepID=UPI003F9FB904
MQGVRGVRVRGRATMFMVALAITLLVAALAVAPRAAAQEPADASRTSVAGMGVRTADLSKFQPGNIISDAAFFDKGTMTEAQIQTFLESKVRTCQSGYTCLKDWYDTSRSTSADAMCGAYSGGYRERASAIIYKVAQACGINPQVILVTLQKEQGLVLHTWPSEWRYTIAMGQGCPDTAACDTRYYGFFNQVYGAAWQLKRYGNPPGTSKYFTWYAPGKTWNVLYNPNSACGSSPVYIQNQATANLYYYTPYQPNAASLRAGYGEGDGCSTYGNRNFYNYFNDWFGSPSEIYPFGNVEVVEARPGQFLVSGWAADPNTTDPIDVHVYVGSVGTAVSANLDRADVGAAYPRLGSKHGFSASVPATGPGSVDVCVYGINAGPGANVLFGCWTRTAMSGAPMGALESAVGVQGGIQVTGWAIDPDSAAPSTVHVYVGATGTALTADVDRADIGSKYPAYGSKHGYSSTIPAAPGTYDVCSYGINTGPGANVQFGCTKVVVPALADIGRAPMGAFETLDVSGNTATATGWAIDPDTASPIKVHLYVGAVGAEYTADKARADLAGSYPAYGANHGFVEKLTLPAGTSTVCAYGINTGAGGHTLLGCRTATVSSLVERGRPPVGAFESLTVSGNTATATGWALDPDTATPIKVHLYVGAVGAEYNADKSRPDLVATYPEYGANHGFSEKLTLPTGTSQVCAYAINTGAGGHTLLGCKPATVASTIVDRGRAPFGNLEAVTPTAGGAVVSGWALDPDTTAPIAIHIYVDAAGAAYVADDPRGDVAAAYGLGDLHGFTETVKASSGPHTVCVYGINSGAGGHTLIGCRSVVVP